MLRKAGAGLGLSLCLFVVAGCGDTYGPTPPAPLPKNVPTEPVFADPDAVVDALAEKGIDCPVQGRSPNGASARCVTHVDGGPYELSITVSKRAEMGSAVKANREPPNPHTLVAGGNWYIRFFEPEFAPRVAKALKGVVLEPFEETGKPEEEPPYKDELPEFPDKPAYKSLTALAERVDAAVGCVDGEGDDDPAFSWQFLKCSTGKGGEERREWCADLAVYENDRARDEGVWAKVSGGRTPKGLVVGANWSVALCDEGLVDDVIEGVGGVEVK
ncbi:hypothetical protein [Streptomyces luteolus]|uniref:Lipoprotein n=1 Tax=Streptomyces luteolus TaxID=3043615 RepID=A0ABT6SR81_9ACTN|nr:hypothetical protein [Streptomyces sp. B-S-A12]MDI3418116.1 hypothetical protein [Streptomyces sp. B-S-A12]